MVSIETGKQLTMDLEKSLRIVLKTDVVSIIRTRSDTASIDIILDLSRAFSDGKHRDKAMVASKLLTSIF